MKRKQQIDKWKKGGKIIFLAFLIGIILRFFVVESVYVSTSQMAKTYSPGDLLFVSKLAYGIHVPFSSVYFPIKKVLRNDIVLAKIPGLSRKILTRCIGLPGDTVIASENKININGSPAINPPSLMAAGYDGKHFSKLEWYLHEESQPGKPSVNIPSDTLSYTVIVPKAGMSISLDSLITASLYDVIFIDENAEKKVFIKNGNLYLGGLKQTSYTFKRNYYWVLSDNRKEGLDSRHFGFVSERNIEGKALGVWMHLNFLTHE